MKWGWLKPVGRAVVAVAGSGIVSSENNIVKAVIASATAIEMVSHAQTGPEKEAAAINAVPALLQAASDKELVSAPLVQDAMRKVAQCFVAAQNAEEALEDAKKALADVIADVKLKKSLR